MRARTEIEVGVHVQLDDGIIAQNIVRAAADDDAGVCRKFLDSVGGVYKQLVVGDDVVELNGRGRTAVVRVHQREQKAVGAPFVRLFEVLFGNTALFRGVFENPFVVVRNSQPFTQFLGDLSAAAAELSR